MDIKKWKHQFEIGTHNVYEILFGGGDVSTIKHGLKIPPDMVNYNKFVSKIRESEEEFVVGM